MTDVARLEVKVMSMCGEIENLQRELKIANEKIRAIERAKANNVHS